MSITNPAIGDVDAYGDFISEWPSAMSGGGSAHSVSSDAGEKAARPIGFLWQESPLIEVVAIRARRAESA